MAVSKVVLNGTTLMDVTNDTVDSDKLLSGYTATKNDGTTVTGNIPTKTSSNLSVSGKTVTAPAGYYASNASASVATGAVTSGSANISSASFSYNSTSGKFNISGSASIGAPTVGTDGFVSSSEGTKTGNTATLSAEVAKITGSVSITGTKTYKPVISKQSTPAGVTDASIGDATTTVPSSGIYVAVKSASNTGTITATPSISTAGYGTSSNHGLTAGTDTVGASESDITYVRITPGSVTNNTTLPSGSSSAGTINRGSYIKIEQGYHTNTRYYLAQENAGTKNITSSGITNVNGYLTANVLAGTITNNTSGGTSSGTINRGSQIKIGKGFYDEDTYYTAQDNSGTKTINTSGSTSVDGYKYASVSEGTITNNTSGGTSSGTINRGNQIKIGKGFYDSDKYYTAQSNSGTVTISSSGSISVDGYASASVPSGEITNNTSGGTSAGTISRGSQIKIGTGFYDNDLYYTAEDNSGTINISSSGTTTVDGYKYASVSAGSVTNNTSGGASSGTINRGNQIKIGAGFYDSDTYYTAQDNSGTKTISVSGTTSVDGYKNASVPAGSITNNTSGGASSGTINRGSQIKIGAGFYDADVYYTAQSNTGTKTISSSGSTSVDGYKYASVSAGSITNNTTGGTSSGTISRGNQIKIGAGYYDTDTYYTAQSNTGTVSISSSGTTSVDGYEYASVSAGSITNNTSGGTSSGTINRGSQIKIGAGYYNADTYYTAQANTGTKSITTSNDAGTNISCDGYANVNISGINVPIPSSGTNSFSIKLPNGDGNITFTFTVDTSGNVAVTES